MPTQRAQLAHACHTGAHADLPESHKVGYTHTHTMCLSRPKTSRATRRRMDRRGAREPVTATTGTRQTQPRPTAESQTAARARRAVGERVQKAVAAPSGVQKLPARRRRTRTRVRERRLEGQVQHPRRTRRRAGEGLALKKNAELRRS